MKNSFLLVNLLFPMIAACSERQLVTRSNAQRYLGTSIEDDVSLNRVNGILTLANTTFLLKKDLPQDPDAKKLTKVGLGSAALVAGGKYFFDSQTRGISDFSTLIGIGIGTAATTAIVYGWIGRELETIVNFKGTLNKLTKELSKMEALVAELKASNGELSEKVDNTVTLTAELKEALPAVIEASGDTLRLTDVLQLTIDELKEQRVLVAYLINQLPQEQRAEVLKEAGITIKSEETQKAEALKAYNKGRLLRRTQQFKNIPKSWLLNNGFENLLPKEKV